MSFQLTCSPLEQVKSVVGDKLKGEADYHRWAGRMKRAIESVNKYYLMVLTKEYEPPNDHTVEVLSIVEAKNAIMAYQESIDEPVTLTSITTAQANAYIKDNCTDPNIQFDLWDKAGIMLACFITATIDNRIESQLSHLRRGDEMWDMLAELYGNATKFTYVQVYNNWTSIEYKQGGGYVPFLSKWRQAYDDVLNMVPAGQSIPQFIVYTTFINAVSKNPDCSHWVQSNKWSIDKIDVIKKVIPEFVVNEQRAHSMRAHSASSAATIEKSSKKKKHDDKKSEKKSDKKSDRKQQSDKQIYYCRFHKKHVTHKEEECYYNPTTPAQSASTASTTSTTEPAELSAKMAHVGLSGSRITELFDDGADDHLNCSADFLPPSVNPTTSLDTDITCLASARVDTHGQHDWMVDSGTTHSMTPYAANFISFTECRRAVKVAEGSTCHTKGYGDVILDIAQVDGTSTGRTLQLSKVWLAPETTSNLLSVSDLNQAGHIILFVGDQGHIYTSNANYRSETPLASATLRNKQYWLHTADTSKGQLEHLMRANQLTISIAASTGKSPTPAPISVDLAHRRACHAGERKVKHMPHHSTGITLIKGSLKRPCGPCVQGKGHALPYGSKDIRSLPGEKLHLDVWGPVSIASHGRQHYFVTITDDYSRFCWVFLIKSRSEVLDCFIKVEQYLKTQFNYVVKQVVGDNATEHIPLADYLVSKGVIWHPTPPYTKQLNGVAEIKNRYLIEPLVAVMTEHQLPKHLWGELLLGVNYTMNRLWHSTIERTPYGALHGTLPDISNLRALGCQCWYHIPKERRESKLHPHMEEGRLVGYDSQGYRIYDIKTRKIMRSRNVIFQENPVQALPSPAYELDTGERDSTSEDEVSDYSRYVPRDFLQAAPEQSSVIENRPVQALKRAPRQVIYPTLQSSADPVEAPPDHALSVPPQPTSSQPPVESPVDAPSPTPAPRRSTRIREQLEKLVGNSVLLEDEILDILASDEQLCDVVMKVTAAEAGIIPPKKLAPTDPGFTPTSYKEAISCLEHERWRAAIHKELSHHNHNGTWRTVDKPKNQRLLTLKST
ncbi:hypothetical protein N7486_001253 [Penicillium sp. IBT 16267x]|nr:hypothetical protein N7486_001253 [Penicillium sp. IBT 16267x]